MARGLVYAPGLMMRWRAVSALVLCAALGACTPVRGPQIEALEVRVEADEEVRAELDEVEVVVESRTPGANSWDLAAAKRFTPDPVEQADWPLEFVVKAYDSRATYQVTATARDQAGAITIQARSIAEPMSLSGELLRVRFDRECLRRSQVCGRSYSCAFGECVDAREPLRDPIAVRGERASTVNALTPEQMSGANAAQPCPVEGAHTCALADNAPLLCEQGSWQLQAVCGDMLGCDTADAETHGICQPVAPECAAREPGGLFCDADGVMHRCQENAVAHVKPCGENEHCVDVNHDVRCSCLPGFIPDSQGCVEARDCKDSGGCDPLTTCEMRNGERTCSACPPGYSGTGESGCAPLLRDLQVTGGVLEPAFDPNIIEYRLRIPLLVPQISIIAQSDADAALSIDNTAASLNTAWTSPILASGPITLPFVLRASTGARTDYRITIEQADSEPTYFKSSSCQRGGWFGEYFAAHGDTLVVGAPLETVGQADSAGAVYVFVREGNAWREQARLISPEPITNASFGMGVDIWEDRLAIGAPGGVFSVLGMGNRNGEVHVFKRTGGTWRLEQTVPSGRTDPAGDAFGFRVSLRDDDLVTSAPFDDDGGSYSGAIYTHHYDGSSWQLLQRIKQPNPVGQSHFGVVVVRDSETLVIGATQETVDSNTRAGAAYVYKRSADGWSFVQRLLAPVVRPLAQFGYSAATLGDTLVVSAPHNPAELSSNRSGEVHVFRRIGDQYKHENVLEGPAPNVGDYFGNGVSMNESWLAVGAARDAPAPTTSDQKIGQGKVYLFGRSEQRFVRARELRAANADAEDHFGDTVALTDDYIAIGVREEDGGSCGIDGDASDNSESDSGAVFVLH